MCFVDRVGGPLARVTSPACTFINIKSSGVYRSHHIIGLNTVKFVIKYYYRIND